jgi:hypothetical protein
MVVILIPFLISPAWDWQVHRDRTVLWAILRHTLLQIGHAIVRPGVRDPARGILIRSLQLLGDNKE